MKTRYSLGLLLWFFISTFAQAQIPAGYYDQAAGKSGEVLRAALRDITTTGHVKISYASIWTAYAVTDVRPAPDNLIVWDMYSPDYTFTIYTDQNSTGGASAEGESYSREHCMPNSWWGGLDNAANPQYSDLHHLFPADQYVNNRKSNYIVAQTSTPSYTSTNGSKVGSCTYPGYTGTVFEPINEYKGDFARAYLYLATRYMNYLSVWVNTYTTYDSKYIINTTGGNYKQWYIDMLIAWNNSDPVSQKEIDRNNRIYYDTPQHNRNPFIDHPEYVNAVWGGPILAVTTSSITGNNYILGSGPSASKSYTLSGTTLTPASGNITINGSADYEVSTDNASFGPSRTIAYSLGALAATPVYVRLKSGLASGNYNNELITNSGGGALPINVTFDGSVSVPAFLPEPTNYPASFSVPAHNIQLQWIDAIGSALPDGYLVRMSDIGFGSIVSPVDGTAVANSGTDQNVAFGIQKALFSNLQPSTIYYFKLFSYTGSGSTIDYKTDGTIPQSSQSTSP